MMNANNFRAVRLLEGMTQKEFAELLEVSESTVAAIESGRRNVSDMVRARVAKIIDIEQFSSFYERYNEFDQSSSMAE